MKKLSILSLHLGYGGIEECISRLANELINFYDVEIVCTYKVFDIIPHELDSRIKITYLTDVVPNRKEIKEALKSFNIFKLIKESFISLKVLYLKKYKNIDYIKNSDADIIISTRDYFNYLLGKYGKKDVLKVGWEHNHHHGDLKYVKNLTRSCKKLDKLILVSESLKNYYETIFKNEYIKCECIFIPNFLERIPTEISLLNNNNIIAVGRLEQVKGFEDLIDVIYIVNKFVKVNLNIIGDGSLKEVLQKKIDNYKLGDVVKLHGSQNRYYIDNMYKNSSLYVMSSFTESFGLVLIEAMSFGLPCIAFSSAEGACDLIKDDYNGYLISDRNKDNMVNKIISLLDDREKMNKLCIGARASIVPFEKSTVINNWIRALEDK